MRHPAVYLDAHDSPSLSDLPWEVRSIGSCVLLPSGLCGRQDVEDSTYLYEQGLMQLPHRVRRAHLDDDPWKVQSVMYPNNWK